MCLVVGEDSLCNHLEVLPRILFTPYVLNRMLRYNHKPQLYASFTIQSSEGVSDAVYTHSKSLNSKSLVRPHQKMQGRLGRDSQVTLLLEWLILGP